MKKLLIICLLLVMTNFISVNATTQNGFYDFTVFDNEGYDLITGNYVDDINLSRTNRIVLSNNSIDDAIYFDNTYNVHHVLFFNSFNVYIGYYNLNGTQLELSTYINDAYVDGDYLVVDVPEGASKFALMNYNYEDTRNLTIYTQPSIDIEAFGGLTYREIFAGNDLIVNGDFSIDSNSDGLADDYTTFGGNITTLSDGEQTVTRQPVTGWLQLIQFETFPQNHDFYIYSDIVKNGDGSYNFRIDGGGSPHLNLPNDISGVYFTTTAEGYSINLGVYNALENTNIVLNELMIFDLTSIFGATQPNITEFETMLDYYQTYKDVSGDEISYNDIYANNLITNGNFETDLNDWAYYYWDGVYGSSWENGRARIRSEGTYTTFIQSITDDFILDDEIYISYDYENIGEDSIQFNIYAPIGIITTQYLIPIEIGTYSNIVQSLGDSYSIYFKRVGVTDIYLDNIISYNLTETFGYVGAEIDTDWIELHYLTWIDPLEVDYSVYYQAGSFYADDIIYLYDDTPLPPADFQDTFNESIESIGIDSTPEKLFGAFLLMISLAVLLGLRFKSVAVVLIAELSLVFIFTVLGWFSLWFIVVIALMFVLMLILKGLKGGKE